MHGRLRTKYSLGKICRTDKEGGTGTICFGKATGYIKKPDETRRASVDGVGFY
jgi:hypothetical protein